MALYVFVSRRQFGPRDTDGNDGVGHCAGHRSYIGDWINISQSLKNMAQRISGG